MKVLAVAPAINLLVGSDGISVMLIASTRIEKNQVFILGATPNNPALWDKKEKQSYRSSRST